MLNVEQAQLTETICTALLISFAVGQELPSISASKNHQVFSIGILELFCLLLQSRMENFTIILHYSMSNTEGKEYIFIILTFHLVHICNLY